MSIGTDVRDLRKRAGLTQTELAKRAGVGLRFVRELEQGKQTMRLDKVSQVLRLFSRKLAVLEETADEIG
jgi:y4mF family transcriptional regulator